MAESLDSSMMEAAVDAVVAASAVTRSVQADLSRLKVVTKDDHSPVTLADYAAQAVVAHRLSARLGSVRLVAEERADELRKPDSAGLLARTVARAQAVWPDVTPDALLDAIDLGTAEPEDAGFWTLDPVDGTKGFLRGQQYCVSLAYVVGGQPVLGVLGCPNLDPDSARALDDSGRGLLVSAVRGGGFWQGALTEGAALAAGARVSPAGDDVRTCESVESKHSNHDAHARILEAAGLRATAVRLDSQAKYAVVARGQADIYLRLPSSKGYVEKIWDHAAGSLVAEEAGLQVTDFAGRKLDFGHGRRLETNRGVLVAGGAHHPRILASIRSLGFSPSAPL